MKVVVEAAEQDGVSGWAFDEDNPAGRLTVHVTVEGRFLGLGRADMPRADLLANDVGDGCYGFKIAFSSDDLHRIAGHGIEVFAVSGDGTRADAMFVTPQVVADSAWIPRASSAPVFVGSSFLADNLRDFNARAIDVAPEGGTRDFAGVYTLRMYVFGDSMWWSGARHVGTATAARFFEFLGPRTREAIAAGRAMLLLDMSNEGAAARGNADWLSLLHDELDRQAISASACLLLTQNRAFGFDYRLWCTEIGRSAHMHVLHYDYYVARMAYRLEADALPPPTTPPDKGSEWRHFVCLNFTPREPRTSVVSWLIGSGLAERGFVSFHGFENYKESVAQDAVPDWFPDAITAEKGRAMLRERGRMCLDLPDEEILAAPEFDLGPVDCYARSFFTIVTETDFFGCEIDRISEKVIKPLALGHPIVVVGNPGALARVRDLGFLTFHPLVDERYDAIDDRAERMRCLQSEIARLCALSHGDLLATRERLAEKIEYNRHHARRRLAARFRERIEPELLACIAGHYKHCLPPPSTTIVRNTPCA